VDIGRVRDEEIARAADQASHVVLVNTAQNLLRRDGPASDRRKR
jgi:hypothetical protein